MAHVIGRLRTGGAERQLVNYLMAANRCEFRHTAVCLSGRGELADQVEAAGISVVRMPVRTRDAAGSLWRFASWLRQEDVAVVHTHMHHAALWGRVAGKLAGVPVMVTTEHGKEMWKSRLQVEIDHGLSKWTARHIAVARDGLDIRRRRERIAEHKLILIPNGVSIPDDVVNQAGRDRVRREFGLGPGTPVLGTVGRVVEAKGYGYLLAAVQEMRSEFPDLRWLAAGDGDCRAALSAQTADMGLTDMVIWAGNRSDIGDFLAAIDVWVMSSIREGLPVALLEAMAARKPIVATRVGGIPDAARDGQEALLTPSADPSALAKGIGRLLRDREHAERLAASARKRAVEEYGIVSVAARIEQIYRQELDRSLRKEVR